MNKEGGPKKPICTQVTVNETRIKMEIDTGCAVTLIPEKIWRLIKQPALKPTSKRLRTYTGEPVEMLGKFVAEARIKRRAIDFLSTSTADRDRHFWAVTGCRKSN